ncbi:MAG: hypothetical protein JWQ40_5206 [Segetibacter sp.]|nr:hypothetical protein [Segetibacter sp.]
MRKLKLQVQMAIIAGPNGEMDFMVGLGRGTKTISK